MPDRVRDQEIRSCTCPLCHAPLEAAYEKADSLSLYQCPYCLWVSVHPIEKAEVLQHRILTGQHEHRYYSPTEHSRRPSRLYRWLAGRLRRWTRGNRLLDLGCGFGAFLQEASVEGWNCTGIDKSEPFLETARARLKGVEFLQGDISNLETDGRTFDAVTAIDLLAHVPDPLAALRNIHTRLDAHGVFFLQTGTFLGIPPSAIQLDVPNHLHAYPLESLLRLLSAAGFSVRQVDSIPVLPGIHRKAGLLIALFAPEILRRVLLHWLGQSRCASSNRIVWIWCRKQ